MSVPDNFDLYEYEERQRAAAERRRPHCYNCEEPIWDDFAYRIDGVLLCEACIKSMKEYIEEDEGWM